MPSPRWRSIKCAAWVALFTVVFNFPRANRRCTDQSLTVRLLVWCLTTCSPCTVFIWSAAGWCGTWKGPRDMKFGGRGWEEDGNGLGLITLIKTLSWKSSVCVRPTGYTGGVFPYQTVMDLVYLLLNLFFSSLPSSHYSFWLASSPNFFHLCVSFFSLFFSTTLLFSYPTIAIRLFQRALKHSSKLRQGLV